MLFWYINFFGELIDPQIIQDHSQMFFFHKF